MNNLTERKNAIKSKKGFTLIELIVVIVIIGILAAILIPRFTGFSDKARMTDAVIKAKQVATAVDAYYTEHSAYTTTETDISTISGVADGTGVAVSLEADGGVIVAVTVGTKTYTAARADGNTPVLAGAVSGT